MTRVRASSSAARRSMTSCFTCRRSIKRPCNILPCQSVSYYLSSPSPEQKVGNICFAVNAGLCYTPGPMTKPTKKTRDFLLRGLPEVLTAHIKELERKGIALTLPKEK